MKFIKNILFTLVFMLLASSVYATSAIASFTVNDLDFGSIDQARGQDVTSTLHLINDGTETVTLSLSSTLTSTYNARFSQSTITLQPNASSDITVTLFVPLSQTSSKTLLTGGIVITSTNFVDLVKTAKVYLTTASMLEISKVTVEIDGSEHTLRDGETYSDTDTLKAGTPITVKIYVKNLYSSSEDIDIEDVSVDVRSSGDLDLDDSDDIGDLSYGDKESVSFSADIPSDAEDGDTYDLDIKATGRDTNGALHVYSYSTSMEVKRKSHEILITSASIYPQVLSCNDRATVTVGLENTGRYDENKVGLTIVNDELDIAQEFNQMGLDTDSTMKKSYSFVISNRTLPGQYDLTLTSYYDSNENSDMNVVSFIVEPCSPIVNNNQTINTNNTQPPIINNNGVTPVYGTASFADSTLYLTLLIIAIVVLIIILIILLVKFVF